MYKPLSQTDAAEQPPAVHHHRGGGGGGAVSELNRRRFLIVLLIFVCLLLTTGALVASLGSEKDPVTSEVALVVVDPETATVTGIDEIVLDGFEIKSGDEEKSPRLVEIGSENEPNLVEKKTSKEEEEDELRVNEVPDDDSVDGTQSSTNSNDGEESTPSVVKRVIPKPDLGQCQYWTRHVRETFPKECSYWLDAVNEWENAVNPLSKRFVGYHCDGTLSCHGWGDRMAGILSSFFKALNTQKAFKISHDYLAKLFQPCVIGGAESSATDWTKNPFKYHFGQSCVDANIPCPRLFELDCKRTALVGVNTNRVCLDRDRCQALKRMHNQSLNAIHSMGCPSRLLLEPSKELFENSTFPFKYDGQVKPMSLKQIQELFEDKYYVITIQMRLGDHVAFESKESQVGIVRKDRKLLLTPLKCATTIESYFKDEINGKPVRYFLATDTYEYRRMVEEVLGDKLMAFDVRPEHIGSTSKKYGLTKELAEWYVLGLGEQLILNKLGLEKEYFRGRISAFAKTAWVHHLKHWVFDAGTCRNYSITLDGTWDDLRRRGCDNPYLRGPTLQNHMLPIVEKNLTFPDWYVGPDGGLASGVFRADPKGEDFSSSTRNSDEEEKDPEPSSP